MSLYAAGENGTFEPFATHVSRVRESFSQQAHRLLPVVARVLSVPESVAARVVDVMLTLHDVGKLTEPWQFLLAECKRVPPHAALGGVVTYLYLRQNGLSGIAFDVPVESLAAAAGIAIAIHHIDRGTPNSNLDEPDNIAVRHNLVNPEGFVRWHSQAQTEIDSLLDPPFSLHEVKVNDLRWAAGQMRQWARGGSVLQMHARRLQMSVLHHTLRVCDLRAAGARGESNSELVRTFQEGGLVW